MKYIIIIIIALISLSCADDNIVETPKEVIKYEINSFSGHIYCEDNACATIGEGQRHNDSLYILTISHRDYYIFSKDTANNNEYFKGTAKGWYEHWSDTSRTGMQEVYPRTIEIRTLQINGKKVIRMKIMSKYPAVVYYYDFPKQ